MITYEDHDWFMCRVETLKHISTEIRRFASDLPEETLVTLKEALSSVNMFSEDTSWADKAIEALEAIRSKCVCDACGLKPCDPEECGECYR